MTELTAAQTTTEIYPWHRDNWEKLHTAYQAGRLPHALLLTGAQGLGKHQFAIRLAASLMCNHPHPDGAPCGACQGCQLFHAGTHPDYRRIEPEKPGKAIPIDTIRAFIETGSLTAQAGNYKITIIEPADSLNVAAANALLKTLEEPVPYTLMILVTARPGRLPATIRSRCQTFQFAVPERGMAAQWLAAKGTAADPELLLDLSSGAPLQAQALDESEALRLRQTMLEEFIGIFNGRAKPVTVAARWCKLDQQQVLHWLSSWIVDLIRLKMSSGAQGLINSDQKERLQALARKLELKALYNLLDQTFESIRTLGSQLNSQMAMEGLLLAWSDCRQAQR